jgi:hypothetical protein
MLKAFKEFGVEYLAHGKRFDQLASALRRGEINNDELLDQLFPLG